MSLCLPGLQTQQRGAALWAFLSRPQRRNAIDRALAQSLCTLFRTPQPRSTRAIVLASSTPGVFCAGGDLRWMASAPQSELAVLWDALRAAQRCPLPVVARVDGLVAGGGAGLVAACDVAFSATAQARVAMREVRVGLVPAMVSSFVVGKLAGSRAALARMLLAGEEVDGAAASRAGLTNAHFATAAEMDAEIARFCAALERCSPDAVAATKRLLVEAYDRVVAGSSSGMDRLRDAHAAELVAARSTPDGREGVAAFLEKRRPVWRHDE